MAAMKTTSTGAAPAAPGARDEKVAFFIPSGKHQLVAKAQRDFIGSIADRIEKGEPIARAAERQMIAGILRAWARQIPDALPSSEDGVAKIEPAYAAIHFACLVNGQGRSKEAALAELAEIYDASTEAIAEAIAKFEGRAMRLVPKKPGADASGQGGAQ
jgi:hypothetical protein